MTADGDTPLLSAILSANPLPLVTLLCERGADIEARDYRMGNTPLILAVARPMGAQMAELLLSRGACATLPNAAGDTPVHAAAFAGGEGALRSLRLLLKHGALINAPGHNGETALHVAARRGHVAVVRFLLAASPHPVETSGEPMPLAENALRDSGRSGDVAPRAR